jgi:hypothetical protein
MKKIVKNFNGFKKIYENELNSETQSEVKIETKPEEGEKAAEVINQSINQELQNAPIKSVLDNIEAKSQKEIKESVLDPKRFTKATSFANPGSEAELKSKVEALSKDLNVTEELESLWESLKSIVVKNAPKHPTYGKLKYMDGINGILHYENGEERFDLTESERKHIENLLSSSVAKQKTLKWLASTAQVLGGSLFLLGIGMIMFGIATRANLYDKFTAELNKKFGFLEPGYEYRRADFDVPDYYDPANGMNMGMDPVYKKIIDELEQKGMIIHKVVAGGDSMDTFDMQKYGYVYNWDKILTSDQTAQLSSNTLTYLLGGAMASGVGALSVWAGMVLADKNRIEYFLGYFATTLKGACLTIGLPVEKLTNLGDVTEILSRNYSMHTRRPGYSF